MSKRARVVGRIGVVVGCALCAALPAAAQAEEGGIRIVSEGVEIGIHGRLQTQFNTSTVDDVPESELFIRRARLELDVRVNDLVSGRIHPDFAGDRVSLRDVYMQLNFSPAFQLRTGKSYRPFSLLENTSSTRILPIERGVRIRGLDSLDEYAIINGLQYSDRDIGVMALGSPEGAPLGLTYGVGIFRGPQHQVEDETTYQYAARATVSPVEDLRVGAGWSNRSFVESVGELVEVDRGNAFEVDLEIGGFDPGFHLLGEVTMGDFNPSLDVDFMGAQAWLAYRTGALGRLAAVEPILRASYGDLDTDLPAGELGGTLLTPGVNLYLGGRNRLMFNYDFFMGSGDGPDEGSFKAQFQLAF